MKRTDLIRKLEEAGCEFVRRGWNHDWYRTQDRHISTGAPPPRDQRVFGKTHPEEARELNEHPPFWATSSDE
jgi:hypothetical protein